MSKTPYEIRLDVVKMAQEMLDKEKSREHAIFLAQVDSLRETQAYSVQDFVNNYSPKTYTTADVVTRSKELYNFVTDNKTTK